VDTRLEIVRIRSGVRIPRLRLSACVASLVVRIVVPRYRGLTADHRAGKLRGGLADGARVRIRYTLEGREIEEDIFCVISSVSTHTGSGPIAEEQIHWVAESLFAFRAERGPLDPLARAMRRG
jgi:hypothetical protein